MLNLASIIMGDPIANRIVASLDIGVIAKHNVAVAVVMEAECFLEAKAAIYKPWLSKTSCILRKKTKEKLQKHQTPSYPVRAKCPVFACLYIICKSVYKQ